ncbi:unnamed protein product [Parajaminaea phylloscopi]
MTRAEAAPSSVAEYEKDKHSRTLPGASSGPNKDSISHPNGASVLGTEIGAESDARRERIQAEKEGDQFPPTNTARNTAGDLGFGQSNGADLGVTTPGQEGRDQLQQQRNSEFAKGVPDLAKIAQTSGGSAAHQPTFDQDKIISSGQTNPSDLLNQVGQSQGQPTRTGAFDGEVTRDAPTNA